jgi:hypothetical protein
MGVVFGLGPEDPHSSISMPTTVMSYSPNLPPIFQSYLRPSGYYPATRSQSAISGGDSYVG